MRGERDEVLTDAQQCPTVVSVPTKHPLQIGEVVGDDMAQLFTVPQ
jgi:hypothetical protein